MKKLIVLLILLLAVSAETAFSGNEEITSRQQTDGNVISSPAAEEKLPDASPVSRLNGRPIGVQTGTNFVPIVEKNLPDSDISYYNSIPDLVLALVGGKIDGFPADEPVVRYIMKENDDVTYISENLDPFDLAFVFRKDEDGKKLCDQLSEFLMQIKTDGTLEKLGEIWFDTDESKKVLPDYASFPAPNGILKLAVEAQNAPFVYISETKVTGYEIDIAARFCEQYGYGLEINDMGFDAILPSVQSGKYDFGCSMISITEERAESVYFSEPDYSAGVVFAVRPSFLNTENTAVSGEDHQTSAIQEEPAASSLPAGEYTELAELAGKKIGVQMGTIFDRVAAENISNAEILYFNNFPDELTALGTGKIDGVPTTEMTFSQIRLQNAEYTVIDKKIGSVPTAYVFPKTEKGGYLQAQMNEFLRELRENGEMEHLKTVWAGIDESRKVMTDYKALPDINGRLRFATEGDFPPFDYVRDDVTVGYDVEIAARFCEKYGYALDVDIMNFSALMPAVQAGKYDFAASGIAVTDERKEMVLFSDPNIEDGIVVMVRAAKAPGFITNIWNSVSESFERTFLRENRYRLFWQGILKTLLITVLSIFFGTALGFCVFMLCRNGNPVANGITNLCFWLVQGMPGVVLLMILYYVIFGSTSVSGIWVAVIGFTLTFGAAVFGLLKLGVGAIDRGQYEAAMAMGFSDLRTFFRIILPQAIPHVLDAYTGEITGLLKATAVVGYIAVQDLTKMGDIVRSRTYEAFFPLIAVTIIYFVLEGIFGFIMKLVRRRLDPKRRDSSSILKGISHD